MELPANGLDNAFDDAPPKRPVVLTLRPSLMLNRRLGVTTPAPSLPITQPYADWSAHTFMAGRYRFLIFTNTPSLLSFVTAARGVTTADALIKQFATSAAEHLRACGQETAWQHHIAPALAAVQFARIPSRSVQGSMNELVLMASCALAEGASATEASLELLKVPMSALKMDSPLAAFRALADLPP